MSHRRRTIELRIPEVGEEQSNDIRRRIDYVPGTVTDERESVVFVLSGSLSEPRAHGILRNVGEGTLELAQAPYNETLETIVPHVAVDPVVAIKPQGEATQDPLHYARKRLAVVRVDHEVKVILHNADVHDCEIKFRPGANKDCDEHRFHNSRAEDVLAAVRPSHNVVGSALYNSSRLSHTPGYCKIPSTAFVSLVFFRMFHTKFTHNYQRLLDRVREVCVLFAPTHAITDVGDMISATAPQNALITPFSPPIRITSRPPARSFSLFPSISLYISILLLSLLSLLR